MLEKPFDLIEHLREFYEMQARVASLNLRVMELELITEKLPRKKTNISEPRRTS